MVPRRDSAISSYCSELGMMERLRHELLLLHNKVHLYVTVLISMAVFVAIHELLMTSFFMTCVSFHWQVQSQEELIGVLSQQLREARQEKASLQLEFSQYRKHSQVHQYTMYKETN